MITGDCILATGRPGNHGYYRKMRNNVAYLAHRLAYEDANGPIPPKWQVHHLCHNKQCINPLHLVAMPHGDHVRVHGLSGVAAIHAAKVTCANGHPFDGRTGKQRTCSICHLEAVRKYAAKKRAQRPPRQRRLTCRRGHPFDGYNGKNQTCSICRRERQRRYEAKLRVRKAAA